MIPADDARALLGALLELLETPPIVDARYGDLVNVRERWLEQRVGPRGGLAERRPPAARGRPDRVPDRPARAAARPARGHAALRDRLVDAAERERDTLMPDYTYLQVAQPTTAGHWLLSFAYPALRDVDPPRGRPRLGQSQPGRRGRRQRLALPARSRALATLLGFDAPIEHTRDAMWQTDPLTETVWHAATAATNASRFAEDLELYGSDEFGLLRIGDELCRASALMPQKRNPYALVVIRGAAGTLLGRATGVLATQRTPSGRTDNLLYAYGELGGAVELATRLVDLAAATAESLRIDRAAASGRCARATRSPPTSPRSSASSSGSTTARPTASSAAPSPTRS